MLYRSNQKNLNKYQQIRLIFPPQKENMNPYFKKLYSQQRSMMVFYVTSLSQTQHGQEMRHFSLLASFDESSPSYTLCLNISSFIACAHRKLFSVCSISAVLFISSLNNATRGCKRCVFHMQITSNNFLQLHLVACIIIFIKNGFSGRTLEKKCLCQ